MEQAQGVESNTPWWSPISIASQEFLKQWKLARDRVQLAVEDVLDLAPSLEARDEPADLKERASLWSAEALRRLESDYIPESGFVGVKDEVTQWVRFVSAHCQAFLPSRTSRPPIVFSSEFLDGRVLKTVPELSSDAAERREIVEHLIQLVQEVFIGAGEEISDDSKALLASLRSIADLGLQQCERNEIIRRSFGQPELLRRGMDQLAPTFDRLKKQLDSGLVSQVMATVVDVLVTSYPFSAISEIESTEEALDDLCARQQRIFGMIDNSGSAEDRAPRLHSVIAENPECDALRHRELLERHLQKLFRRVLSVLFVDGDDDPISVRLQSRSVGDLTLDAIAGSLAIVIWERWDDALKRETLSPFVGALLEGEWTFTLPELSTDTQKRLDELAAAFVQDLAPRKAGFGSLPRWKSSARQDISSSGMLLWVLKQIEHSLLAVHFGIPRSPDEIPDEPLLVREEFPRWLHDYRPVLDNGFLRVLDECLLQVFPAMRDQELIEILEQPVAVSITLYREFAKTWIPLLKNSQESNAASKLLWSGERSAVLELSKEETWESLLREATDHHELVDRLNGLRREATGEIRANACNDLIRLLEMAGRREKVRDALGLMKYRSIDRELTTQLQSQLAGHDQELADSLIEWRMKGVSVMELVKRAHESLLIKAILNDPQTELPERNGIEEALGDITEFFLRHDSLNAGAEAARKVLN